MTISAGTSLFDVIADEASAESPLWQEALLAAQARRPVPVFSPLVPDPTFALGVETIYEGYLAHYGRSRLFGPADDDTALLLGDYLYAHGLVHVAATGDVAAVHDLAELVSLCAQGRADGRPGDGAAWAATAALLGKGALAEARAALRDRGEAGPLDRAARAACGDPAVDAALDLHLGLAEADAPAGTVR
jgi:hypothetical protein